MLEQKNIDAHLLDVEEVLALMETSYSGLALTEVSSRLSQYGVNALPEAKRKSALIRFAMQFHNPLIYVLLGAVTITFALDDIVDTGVIVAVVLVNALIGFIQEGKAEKALEAVRCMLAKRAKVRRAHQLIEIDAVQLVPGDIVVLEPGDKVPADLRLVQVKNLNVMEAALTGESVPVEKDIAKQSGIVPLAERKSMSYSGTLVSAGHGYGVVVATGNATEIGKIGLLVKEVHLLATPLTRRLDKFSKQVTVFILAVSVIAFLYGYCYMRMPLLELFLAIVGIAVAAIPEGLPAVVTIVLAIGTSIMARNKAIVRRLPAVETLGSVTVVCTDKTGTLTCNEMMAVNVVLPHSTISVTGAGYAPEGGFFNKDTEVEIKEGDPLCQILSCAALCNDAELRRDNQGNWQIVGDPTEGALQALTKKAGLNLDDLRHDYPSVDKIPFESELQYMATLHHSHQGDVFVYIKGSPEKVLNFCIKDQEGDLNRTKWEEKLSALAGQGQRVLAFAKSDFPAGTMTLNTHDMVKNFTLLGLIGMIDPPRKEAVEAVRGCKSAGIRVMMITGDHAVTASAIAKQLGLSSEKVFTGSMIEKLSDQALAAEIQGVDVIARASPQDKLRLVAALQANGELVAMTGDGVNDAPAIKAADIGVAMGNKGTDAAREAADIVLTDDNFSTIANAVREGRVVLDNIKKSLLFMLPTNGGEAGVILLAIFAGLTIPVTAGQILWVNMITAVTLAIALAFEGAEQGVMQRSPRSPKEPLITKVMVLRIIFVSALMIITTFLVFEWELARGNSIALARTSAVNMLVMGELVYLFNVRFFIVTSLSLNALLGNRVVLGVSLCLIVFQYLFTYTPWMQGLFGSMALDGTSWLMICTLASVKFLAVEAEKTMWRIRGVKVI